MGDIMGKVWIVNIKTESGDDYCRVWSKKPNNKIVSNKLYKFLGYDTSKELECHFNDNIHFIEIKKHDIY